MAGTRFGARTLARSQALQLLFQAEATGRLVADVLAGDYVLDDRSGMLDTYGAELALGADGLLHELDRAIDDASLNWSVGRMPSVDRNLLRLAIYEMACVEDVAVAVSINEFVDLAKAYGTDESSRFINGILGRVAKRMEAGEDVLAGDPEEDAEPETESEAPAEERDEGESEVPAEERDEGEAAVPDGGGVAPTEGVDDSGEPASDETIAPAPAEAAAFASTETVVPASDETVAPASTETVAPASDEAVAPAPEENAAAPSEEDDDLPAWARE